MANKPFLLPKEESKKVPPMATYLFKETLALTFGYKYMKLLTL